MAPPKNEVMINAVHEILAEDHRLSYNAIADRLAVRGHRRPLRGTVAKWVRELVERKFVEAKGHAVRVPPLMPAYLFLDLPAAAEAPVRQVLAAEQVTFELEVITGADVNALVRTAVRRTSMLEQLRRSCLEAGATDARGALVLRRGPPLRTAS